MDQINNHGSQMAEIDPREYESYMEQTYGPNWKMGFRVGFGKRLGAFLLDILFVVIISAILFFVLPFEGRDEIMKVFLSVDQLISIDIEGELLDFFENNILMFILFQLLILTYWSFEIFIGATLGKKILGIRIADTDLRINKKALTIRFLVKNAGKLIDLLAFSIIGLLFVSTISDWVGFIVFIGFFFVLGRNKQALHDMIAGTAVFNDESIEWSGQNG